MSLMAVKWIIVAGVIVLTVIFSAFIWRKPLTWRVWLISSFFSLLCVLGIVLIWQRVQVTPLEFNVCTPILSQAALEAQLKDFKLSGDGAVVYIPTGIFLLSTEFLSSNDALVTGYIWQKYPLDLPATIERGFSFPEGRDTEVVEAYRQVQNNVETIGWRFSTTLREEYYYDQYPFDRQDIWLTIWPNDFNDKLILTPDLAGYETLIPEQLPGIKDDFVLESWLIKGTYFSYCLTNDNSNFGIANSPRQNQLLELEYNIDIERIALGAMLSYVFPPLITALLMFGILLITTALQEKISLMGWSVSTSLGFSATLLFVIVYAQISMRTQLNAPGVIYLEYLYFIVYLAILLVSVDSILFVYNENIHFIQYQDNLIPKALYWPLLTGSFFIATLLTFV